MYVVSIVIIALRHFPRLVKLPVIDTFLALVFLSVGIQTALVNNSEQYFDTLRSLVLSWWGAGQLGEPSPHMPLSTWTQ